MYTADLNKVIASHSMQLYQYADDCQVCVTTSVDDAAVAALAVDRLAGYERMDYSVLGHSSGSDRATGCD